MSTYLEELSLSEAEEVKRTIRDLFRQTCIPQQLLLCETSQNSRSIPQGRLSQVRETRSRKTDGMDWTML